MVGILAGLSILFYHWSLSYTLLNHISSVGLWPPFRTCVFDQLVNLRLDQLLSRTDLDAQYGKTM